MTEQFIVDGNNMLEKWYALNLGSLNYWNGKIVFSTDIVKSIMWLNEIKIVS